MAKKIIVGLSFTIALFAGMWGGTVLGVMVRSEGLSWIKTGLILSGGILGAAVWGIIFIFLARFGIVKKSLWSYRTEKALSDSGWAAFCCLFPIIMSHNGAGVVVAVLSPMTLSVVPLISILVAAIASLRYRSKTVEEFEVVKAKMLRQRAREKEVTRRLAALPEGWRQKQLRPTYNYECSHCHAPLRGDEVRCHYCLLPLKNRFK